LGYPTKNALKTWYRENEQRQDVNAMQSFNDAEHAVEKAAQEMEHTKETALLY
jgi:thiamine pyrophosphokinase